MVRKQPKALYAKPSKLGNGESGNAASTLPVVQQSRLEQVLAYALEDNTLGLGKSGHTGGLVVEGIGHAIRLRPGMRGCRAEHVVQRCETVHLHDTGAVNRIEQACAERADRQG